MSMRKNAASEAINVSMATLFLSMTGLGGIASGAFFSSIWSGWARSQSGRRPRTGGRRSKLCGGGGEEVAHSSVQARQGLSPAGLPERRVAAMFHTNTRAEKPRMKAPMVESMFQSVQYGRSG